MGICLDTEQSDDKKVSEEADARKKTGKWREEAGLLATPPDGNFPMQNVGPVKFESPTVPVIFILGGPGSGKVTHCDNLSQEKKGIIHINMTDLLQQYAMGNDMQDFSSLSSKTVTEVLMLEMKMSPGAKTFLVSGYPRNMRDVVEYSEKIQIVNGVVLISWRQEALERQIDYGAQLGHVILQLARMELNNFFRNVMPVAEYFDQSELLVQVNGERNPTEVYADFREAVYKILGLSKDTIRQRNNPKSLETQVQVERANTATSAKKEDSSPAKIIQQNKTADTFKKGLPAFIWIIGGPGSNKAIVCTKAVKNMPGWAYISIGELLRGMASSNMMINEALVSGELVPLDIVMQLVEQQILRHRDSDGIIISGFPRDLNQVKEFESKFGTEPPLVLLDCSKLQLSRGRSDDSVSSFRKRLEIFREVTLPMLKTLDNDNRLSVIDGDTEISSVQNEFSTLLYQMSEVLKRKGESESDSPARSNALPNPKAPANINGGLRIEDYGGNNRITNGVAKPISQNDYNAKKNEENKIESHTKNANEIKTTGTKVPTAHQNGVANGAPPIMQNGSATQISNGIIPNNKVAPMNNAATNEHIKKMYSEIDFNPENIHI